MDESALIHHSNRVLTASEIGSYVYCSRAWWLDKVGGYEPLNVRVLEMGEQVHEEHGREVQRAHQMNRTALALIGAAVIVALVWVVLQMVL